MKGLAASSDELLTLDLFRFLSSAAIVYHHSHEFFLAPALRAAAGQRTAGLALFVDLFFFISGFVIAYVYSDRIGQPGAVLRFAQKRFARLMPLHLLTLVLAIVLWEIVKRFAHADHAPSSDPGCIVLTATLLHAIVPCGNGIYYNFANWSLSVEVAMYALYPVMALCAARARRTYLAASLLLFLALGLYAFRNSTSLYNWTDMYDPLRGLPSFMLGTAVAANRDLLLGIRFAQPLSLGFFGVAAFLALNGGSTPLQLAALMLAGILAVAADMQRKVAAWTVKVAPLGQLTYSLYLWHLLIIMVLMNGVADKMFQGNATVLIICTALTYSGIAVVSYLSWRYFETPARQWLDAWFRRRATREARA